MHSVNLNSFLKNTNLSDTFLLKPYRVKKNILISRLKTPDSYHGLWLNYLKQSRINIHMTSQMNTGIWHLINIQPHMHINKTHAYSYGAGIHIYEDSTWQVVKGLMLQRNWGMSWMETCRLKEFALKSRVLGSSRRRPPRPRSMDTTSWEEE